MVIPNNNRLYKIPAPCKYNSASPFLQERQYDKLNTGRNSSSPEFFEERLQYYPCGERKLKLRGNHQWHVQRTDWVI
jgi:hypothetical protein